MASTSDEDVSILSENLKTLQSPSKSPLKERGRCYSYTDDMGTCDTSAIVPTITEENELFFRICHLIMDFGVRIMRNEFDRIHPPATLDGVLKIYKSKLLKLPRGVLNTTMLHTLYPTSNSYGRSVDFDMTLLAMLFRNICNLKPPIDASGHCSWAAEPLPGDYSLEADIVRLKHFRNTLLAHASSTSLSREMFEKVWDAIEDIIVRRDNSMKIYIDSLLTAPFTDLDGSLLKRLEDWYLDDLELKKEFNVLSHELDEFKTDIKEDIQEINQNMRKLVNITESGRSSKYFSWPLANVILELEHDATAVDKIATVCGFCAIFPGKSLGELLVHSTDLFISAMRRLFAKYDIHVGNVEKKCIKIYLQIGDEKRLKDILIKIGDRTLYKEISTAIEEAYSKELGGSNVALDAEHLLLRIETINGQEIHFANYQELFSSKEDKESTLKVTKTNSLARCSQGKIGKEDTDEGINVAYEDKKTIVNVNLKVPISDSSLQKSEKRTDCKLIITCSVPEMSKHRKTWENFKEHVNNGRDYKEVNSYVFVLDEDFCIGRGCSADVYIGYFKEWNIPVVVKQYNKNINDHDPDFAKDLEKAVTEDTKVLNEHTNIGCFLHSFKEKIGGYRHFHSVMKLYDRTLSEYLQDDRNPPRLMNLAIEFISGVVFLHKYNKVHRDLKPENVLLSLEGVLKIVDFGACRSSNPCISTLITGTPIWQPLQLIQKSNPPSKHIPKEEDDVFTAMLILFYILSNGMHPMCSNNEKKVKFDFEDYQDYCNNLKAEKVMGKLPDESLDTYIKSELHIQNSEKRPKAEDILRRLKEAALDETWKEGASVDEEDFGKEDGYFSLL